MGLIHTLLDMSPTVKVIYNTRDPRGIYASRKLLESLTERESLVKVREMCSHIIHDLQVYFGSEEIYSRHFLKSNYDELSNNTKRTSS